MLGLVVHHARYISFNCVYFVLNKKKIIFKSPNIRTDTVVAPRRSWVCKIIYTYLPMVIALGDKMHMVSVDRHKLAF